MATCSLRIIIFVNPDNKNHLYKKSAKAWCKGDEHVAENMFK